MNTLAYFGQLPITEIKILKTLAYFGLLQITEFL
jgi:hypothetical protein